MEGRDIATGVAMLMLRVGLVAVLVALLIGFALGWAFA
jgi:hypothetical protein